MTSLSLSSMSMYVLLATAALLGAALALGATSTFSSSSCTSQYSVRTHPFLSLLHAVVLDAAQTGHGKNDCIHVYFS